MPGTLGVDALIEAAGAGERLGGRPKAFVTLWDRTLLEIAVATVAPVADRVIVAVPPGLEDEARRLVGGMAEVIVGGATRLDTLRCLLAATTARMALVHDVVHPLTTTDLCRQVLSAAEVTGAAAAAVPTASYVYGGYGGDDGGEADRLGPWIPEARWSMRKPLCFEPATLREALRQFDADPASAGERVPGGANVLMLAGQQVTVVTCPTWNVKITTPDDLELCRALGTLVSPGGTPDPFQPRKGSPPGG